MEEKRFNPSKLDKLNNPERIKDFPIDFILKHISFNHPTAIVDIGAGTGFYSIPFAQKFQDCKIYACDISDVMISWMNENIISKYNNIVPSKMEDSKTYLENEQADFLFMVNLHHELDNPEKMLNECYRLLKPGASIAISDWRKEESDRGPSVQIRYEPEQVQGQLIKAGFNNIRIFKDFPNNFLIIADK